VRIVWALPEDVEGGNGIFFRGEWLLRSRGKKPSRAGEGGLPRSRLAQRQPVQLGAIFRKRKSRPLRAAFSFSKDGSATTPEYRQDFPPAQPSIITEFNIIPLFRNESFLRQKYVVEGLSTKQISGLIFSARSTVVASLKRYGITLRDADQTAWYRRGQLGYGKRVVNGRVTVNQREVEIIANMQDLRVKGYSYWKIAEILNSMGVPTKSRRAKWQAATVMKIIDSGGKRSKSGAIG